MAHIPEADRARIYELADEFGVHPSIVRSLYDVMPNELYDGIVNALEDMADDPDYEELFDEQTFLPFDAPQERWALPPYDLREQAERSKSLSEASNEQEVRF